jgi:hypothetical protein
MGSEGIGRGPISVALSGPNAAPFMPQEIVSLMIQLIYPEVLPYYFSFAMPMFTNSDTYPDSYS